MTGFLLWTVHAAGKLPRVNGNARRAAGEMELAEVSGAEALLNHLRNASGRLEAATPAMTSRSRSAFRLPVADQVDPTTGTAVHRQVDATGRQRLSITLDGVARREAEMAVSDAPGDTFDPDSPGTGPN